MSPVHFWFFMTCQQPTLPRPISPSPSELFRHPLFLTPRCRGPRAPFIVPEYFFRDDAVFNGLENSETSGYYVFPSFAWWLFDYVSDPATRLGVGSFITYYSSREAARFIPAGTDVDRLIDPPHSLLKTNWRWEEVLAMLFESRKTVGVSPQPRTSRMASGYSEDKRIIAYFERFAQMAWIWNGGDRDVLV